MAQVNKYECGCIIDNCATRDNPHHVIIHCPMHMEAKNMMAALEEIRDRLDAGLQDEDLDPEAFADTILPALADVARKAAARGGATVRAGGLLDISEEERADAEMRTEGARDTLPRGGAV